MTRSPDKNENKLVYFSKSLEDCSVALLILQKHQKDLPEVDGLLAIYDRDRMDEAYNVILEIRYIQ